jgi:hypothetical protein
VPFPTSFKEAPLAPIWEEGESEKSFRLKYNDWARQLNRYILETNDLIFGHGGGTTGVLDGDNLADEVALIDVDLIITGEWNFTTHPLGLDHTQIANIGTNTHATIDAHLANVANPHVTTLNLARLAGNILSGDVVLTDGSKFYIGDESNNTYFMYNSATSKLELYVNGSIAADWD